MIPNRTKVDFEFMLEIIKKSNNVHFSFSDGRMNIYSVISYDSFDGNILKLFNDCVKIDFPTMLECYEKFNRMFFTFDRYKIIVGEDVVL